MPRVQRKPVLIDIPPTATSFVFYDDEGDNYVHPVIGESLDKLSVELPYRPIWLKVTTPTSIVYYHILPTGEVHKHETS